MFPIKDSIRSRSFPIVNWVIIILNGFIFYAQTNMSASGLTVFINDYALIPSTVDLARPVTLLPFLTHFWLHGSLFHIISNMWMLIVFGDNVEDRMGSLGYLIFYILGGLAAGGLQFIFTTHPNIPALGASGAIAAVMGAYFLFYPRSQVMTFVPFLLFRWFINVPSFIFLGVWFGIQLFSGVTALTAGGGGMGGVAWWAHIGGFAFGLIFSSLFAAGSKKRRTYKDEYYPW